MFTSPTSTISTISTQIIQSESKWSRLIYKRVFGDMHHAEVNIVHTVILQYWKIVKRALSNFASSIARNSLAP